MAFYRKQPSFVSQVPVADAYVDSDYWILFGISDILTLESVLFASSVCLFRSTMTPPVLISTRLVMNLVLKMRRQPRRDLFRWMPFGVILCNRFLFFHIAWWNIYTFLALRHGHYGHDTCRWNGFCIQWHHKPFTMGWHSLGRLCTDKFALKDSSYLPWQACYLLFPTFHPLSRWCPASYLLWELPWCSHLKHKINPARVVPCFFMAF